MPKPYAGPTPRAFEKPIIQVALALSLLLGGCASLSESQCIAGDWQTVGMRDGLAGQQSAHLLNHQNACVKHGVVPDRQEYLAGWEQGVRQYCQPDNGFAVGERGAGYNNVCPAHLQGAFQEAYEEGRQLYEAQAAIEEFKRAIARKSDRLQQIAAQRTSAEADLVDDAATAAERRELLELTKTLSREEGALYAEIQELEIAVAVKSERLRVLRSSLIAGY